MSLRPIDLQTLFMRQVELSREKAVFHDGLVQKQAVEQAESAEETKEQQEKVQRTQETPQGPEAVKDDQDHAQQKPDRRARRKPEGAEPAPEPEAESAVVKDPSLGGNIDLNA